MQHNPQYSITFFETPYVLELTFGCCLFIHFGVNVLGGLTCEYSESLSLLYELWMGWMAFPCFQPRQRIFHSSSLLLPHSARSLPGQSLWLTRTHITSPCKVRCISHVKEDHCLYPLPRLMFPPIAYPILPDRCLGKANVPPKEY